MLINTQSALVPSADSLKRMSKFLVKSRPKDDVPFPGTPGSFDMVVFRGAKDSLIESGLTEEDIESLRTLYEDLRTVCKLAKERGIRVCTVLSRVSNKVLQSAAYLRCRTHLVSTWNRCFCISFEQGVQ